MKRLWLIVTVPLTVVLAVFAVANRDDVALSLWPFDLQLQLPLFLLAIGTLAVGTLIGAVLMWIPLLGWRRRAYSASRRADRLDAELAALRASDVSVRPSGALLPPS
jgi:uncharacterized integral membrane protein